MNIWHNIETQLGTPVAALQQWYESTGTGEFTLEKISSETGVESALLQQALTQLADAELLSIDSLERCIYCSEIISDESRVQNSCINCGDDQDLATKNHPVYIINKAKTRDINWMLVIHGMNTVGTWQQEFSWELANYYKHAVPVFIYKYGNIKIKPLLLISQKKQVDKLAAAIRELQKQAPKGKPDVLAHSYGTLLLSAIIKNPKYKDIQLGRIILVGSIVRPDYDWHAAIANERVEAVMCHHSMKDCTVRLAHFTIPGSGPSGRIGFNDQVHISHHLEHEFGHSSYFEAQNLKTVFPTIWQPFLTQAEPKTENNPNRKPWKPSLFRLITHPLKLLLLIGMVTGLFIFMIFGLVGVTAVFNFFGLD